MAGYVPEIDGMRAVAVLSVFIFHLNPGFLPGGFTGVDVFFTISGFLISGLVMSGLDEGRFSYVSFYQRRIARIVPAATLVVMVALAAGSLLYDRQEFSALGADACAAALSVMNVKQLLQGGYFTASPDTQPLIHYWSLALEEQFYLLFPAMLHLIGLAGRHRRTAILTGLCAAGYAASIVLTPWAPIAGFYLIHTRAWELLAGAVLAAWWRDGSVQMWRYPGARMMAGLALIALGVVCARSAGFPGWIAILPVSGTILMLSAAGHARKSVLHRALVNPLLVAIGKLSFSLYLWHWVVFSFVNYALFLHPALLLYFLKVMLSFAGAIATWYLVETPARAWLNRGDRRLWAFAAFIAVTGLVVWTGLHIRNANYLSASAGSIATGGAAVNAGQTRSVVLIGDSQGAMYAYDIARIARAHGLSANLLASAARNELPNEPDTLWPQVSAFLLNRHFDAIVLAQAWGWKLGPDGEQKLRQAVDLLLQHADRVILIDQLPKPPDGFTRQAIAGGATRLPVFETVDSRTRRLRSENILDRMSGDRVTVMPVGDLVTNPDGSLRLLAGNGRVVYHDSFHLSSSGEDMVHPRLERVLLQALTVRR